MFNVLVATFYNGWVVYQSVWIRMAYAMVWFTCWTTSSPCSSWSSCKVQPRELMDMYEQQLSKVSAGASSWGSQAVSYTSTASPGPSMGMSLDDRGRAEDGSWVLFWDPHWSYFIETLMQEVLSMLMNKLMARIHWEMERAHRTRGGLEMEGRG